jgi:hypothetical protein
LISVCYTSARPDRVPKQVQDWIASAGDAEAIEFIVTIDEARAAPCEALARLPRTRVFVNRGRPCCVDGWNLAARKARGDILVQCSDDLHVPQRWDVSIRERLSNGATSGVLAVSDGLTASTTFLPHAILTRRYYNQFGYMLHDAYWSMWSDNEFSTVAHQKRAVVDGMDIQFRHSHGQIHDDVRAQHDSPHRTATGNATFIFRQQSGFQPWKSDNFATEDAESDGIYSPNWRARLPRYWNQSPKSVGHYLEQHRESLRLRQTMFGTRPPIDEFQVLIPTVPQRREFLDLLLAELGRQGVSVLVDERVGLPVGQKRNDLLGRATGRYVTFIDDDDWVSHDYVEVISDAIVHNRRDLDVLLYDSLVTVESELPRPSFYSFEQGSTDLPDCYIRLPNHLMVWRREVASKEAFPAINRGEDANWAGRMGAHVGRWARVHAFLYFYEFLWSSTTTQR